MHLSRRKFLKQAAVETLLLLPFCSHTHQVMAKQPPGFMYGINAYYLFIEAYRHVRRNKGKNRHRMVYEYLVDKLRLPALRESCGVNSIRYWAFNDYPPIKNALPGALDGRLWQDKDHVDLEALEVLGLVVEILDGLGYVQVPVLSNYWPAYGGILQYLVWAGKLAPRDYLRALCNHMEQELYLENTLTFFTSRRVEEIFRSHVARILSVLSHCNNIAIIEIMNEPRGKNPLSLENRPVGKKMTSDIVSTWLNRQGRWIRAFFQNKGHKVPLISSGEEGWLESPVKTDSFQALNPGGQYFEGIDLLKDISSDINGITIASVHLYLHPAVSLNTTGVCGNTFVDRRGWPHLARAEGKHDKNFFIRLNDEWIISRADSLGGYPWYIGEIGWCWPGQERSTSPSDRKAVIEERRRLYQHWIGLARRHHARGVFIWMLNGLEHKDRFYGLEEKELQAVMAR